MGKDEIKCGDRVFVTKSDGINPSRATDMFRRQSSLVTNIKDGIASLYIIDQYGVNHYAQAPKENLVKARDFLKANSDEDRYARYREGKWNFISQEDFVKEINPEEDRIATPFQDLLAKEKWESYRRAVAGQIAVKLANVDNHPPEDVSRYAAETATMVVKHLRETII